MEEVRGKRKKMDENEIMRVNEVGEREEERRMKKKKEDVGIEYHL